MLRRIRRNHNRRKRNRVTRAGYIAIIVLGLMVAWLSVRTASPLLGREMAVLRVNEATIAESSVWGCVAPTLTGCAQRAFVTLPYCIVRVDGETLSSPAEWCNEIKAGHSYTFTLTGLKLFASQRQIESFVENNRP